MSMWIVWSGIALLKMTPQGSTSTILPAAFMVNPDGSFIHAFAATTDAVPPIPAITIGTPAQKCGHGFSRFQP